MENRTLELKIVSARNIEDVNYLTRMKIYVVVSLAGDISSDQKRITSVDREGCRNPNWNFPMNFTINETLARLYRQYLVFSLRTRRSLGDRDIGKVTVPVNELLISSDEKLMKYVTYQVINPSGKHSGDLNFSYRFGDKINGDFTESQAPAGYGGAHHRFHPDVYPPPPQPASGY